VQTIPTPQFIHEGHIITGYRVKGIKALKDFFDEKKFRLNLKLKEFNVVLSITTEFDEWWNYYYSYLEICESAVNLPPQL
jgi:hypothetical protein